MLKTFRDTSRYIDDLCSHNNPEIQKFLQATEPRTQENPLWIYPLEWLEIPKTGDLASGHAEFLDLSFIKETNGRLHFRKYDKRVVFRFHTVKYINLASNRPILQSYNVAVSQMIMIMYLPPHTPFRVYGGTSKTDQLLRK